MVIGIGTRYSDFTTASRTAFAAPQVRFVNINVAAADASKLAGTALVADAREALRALAGALAGWSHRRRLPGGGPAAGGGLGRGRRAGVRASGTGPGRPSRRSSGRSTRPPGPTDVVVCAAGSMPGDLHKLWRTRDPKGYHVEYGYSCMGYEIAGRPGREAGRTRTARCSSWSATAPT